MTRRAFQAGRYSLNRPAVYILYADHFDKHTFGSELYVGHTAAVDGRLSQHDAEKDYWTVVLVLSSADDWMNTAFTQNLEHTFIKWAKDANRYDVKNGTDSAPTHLGASDKVRLQAFEAGVQDVLRLAGIDVFEWNRQGVYTYEDKISIPRTILKSRMVFETGSTPPMVRILKGSEISDVFAKNGHFQPTQNVLHDSNRRVYLFKEDVFVAVDTQIIIPKILGINLKRWTNEFGKEAKTMFENLTAST